MELGRQQLEWIEPRNSFWETPNRKIYLRGNEDGQRYRRLARIKTEWQLVNSTLIFLMIRRAQRSFFSITDRNIKIFNDKTFVCPRISAIILISSTKNRSGRLPSFIPLFQPTLRLHRKSWNRLRIGIQTGKNNKQKNNKNLTEMIRSDKKYVQILPSFIT